jgi:hypothetical protein
MSLNLDPTVVKIIGLFFVTLGIVGWWYVVKTNKEKKP